MTTSNKQQNERWPEGAIVYQIYPRSLQDSNNDGIGDIKGIIDRLDYIESLSVNAIWLSPFYPSPMADFGYDVANYCDVDPIFGSLDDLKQLIKMADKKNIKLIIDLVPNHTSDEHLWFQKSRSSRDNEFADWYIWRDARHNPKSHELLPPNNWLDAITGGSAWQWEPKRGQFYLHSFDVRQPDLNWSNKSVRAAIKEVMRFWLDLGVAGFRVDAVHWMAKEPLLSDDTLNPDYVEGEDLRYEAVLHNNSRGWPAIYAYLSEMAETLKEEKYRSTPRFMVTEAYPERHNPVAAYMAFYVGVDPEVAAPFNFEGISLPWRANEWRRFLKSFHAALSQFSSECIASYAFGNHDQPRLASRLGNAAARSAAIMQYTLPGMAFVYYGEEIGMKDVAINPKLVKDPAAKNDPKNGRGRDPERTPMQWSPEVSAGFSTNPNPWLPVAPDYKSNNVEHQDSDPDSFLSLYRKLGTIRNKIAALKTGHIEVLDLEHSNVLGYTCTDNETKAEFLVLINFCELSVSFSLEKTLERLIVSSDPRTTQAGAKSDLIELLPYEGVLFSVASK